MQGSLENTRRPSIPKINNNFDFSIPFHFSKAQVADFNTLLKQTDPKETTGPDTVPPKLVKISGNVTDKHLYNIINVDINHYIVSDNTK